MTDKLIIPDGFAAGCLPRETKVGDLCAAFEDGPIDVIPREMWKDYINAGVSVRSFVTKIKNQGSVGSCACSSSTQGNEIVRGTQGLPYVELNPWFVYYHTSGGRDRGSSIDTNLEFIRDKGIAPESVWPRSKGWQTKPSEDAYREALRYRIDEFYDITRVVDVGTALCVGLPVIFGWQGHSCVLTSLVSDTNGEYANSWSPQWGDRGFGRVRLDDINFQYGAFAIRTTSIGG